MLLKDIDLYYEDPNFFTDPKHSIKLMKCEILLKGTLSSLYSYKKIELFLLKKYRIFKLCNFSLFILLSNKSVNIIFFLLKLSYEILFICSSTMFSQCSCFSETTDNI